MKKKWLLGLVGALVFGLIVSFFHILSALAKRDDGENKIVTIRAAHLPNVTHASPLVGQAKGWFKRALGKDVDVRWQLFNGGPSIVEGLFSGRIDIAYLGPGPTINGHIKSEGMALRVLAGATSGGAAFVVREGSGVLGVETLSGKRIAAPQLGNTQYIALRGWLQEAGLKTQDSGGSVEVLPIANPDQLTLFRKGELDGAWTVEPWVSRLEREGGGRILFPEADRWPQTQGKYATTLLVVRKKFLEEHPDLVREWLRAHIELTDWINNHRGEAIEIFNDELERKIGRRMSKAVLESAFDRLEFSTDPVIPSLNMYANMAYNLGFLGRAKPDLRDLVDVRMLKELSDPN